MAKPLTPDICVVGAGNGGLAVAMGAAAYGAKVVLVDRLMPRENLSRGDLAAAALIAAANNAQAVRNNGMTEAEPEIDFKAVMAHVGEVVSNAAPAVSPARLATLGITFIHGAARFIGRRRMMAGDTEIRARRYVLATGSTPIMPVIAGLEEVGCLTADSLFELGRRPGHLVILGSDAAALELAQAFRRLGSLVTLLAEGQVLRDEDPEMAAVVVRRLREEGVAVEEGVKVAAVERRGKTGVKVLREGEGAGEIDGSHLLVAMGRSAEIDGLDLKKARVALKDGVVDVSAMLRTTNRKIYAIGDVAGGRSAQAARHQAERVMRALLFRLPAKDRTPVSRVVRTDPELARVGLSEAEARRLYRRLTIVRWPFAENDLARATGRTQGHVKLVVARSGQLLGVTIAGANASELIAVWALALSKGLTLRDMAFSIPPHPTTGEIGKSAAMAYFGAQAQSSLRRAVVRLLRLFG
ncbi:MAG: NAD(P)/FAD-dependent oxidoreductase [Mesorhizobium sp.]|nr:NAD(P)/FAD-dependent oxidoreductase [Mesorhizobium sp.]MBL8579787.1 NAD(P)/FAD-dependent oxidoreductase [Mesorhizobium sp.]